MHTYVNCDLYMMGGGRDLEYLQIMPGNCVGWDSFFFFFSHKLVDKWMDGEPGERKVGDFDKLDDEYINYLIVYEYIYSPPLLLRWLL